MKKAGKAIRDPDHYLVFICISLLILTSSVNSCSGCDRNETDHHPVSVRKDDLVRANQFLVGKDMDLVNAYAKRRDWNLSFSKTGLGYEIYEKGVGTQVRKGSIVTLEYTLSLLDGRICYSSDNNGLKIFRTGQGGVEAGLEEGVLLLKEGDRARFILPPYLGHGLLGDQNRIPPRAVLIYEVNVVNVAANGE